MTKVVEQPEGEVGSAPVQQATDKAVSLSEKYGCKVHPLVFTNPDGITAVGFVREPPRMTKLAALDELQKGLSSAGRMILESCLLKEESDARLLEDDDFYASAVTACCTLIRVFENQLKKK